MAQAESRDVQLSRDEIVAAAIRVVRAEGLSGLTMNRVAAELGVTAAAIYYYVPNKAGMINLAADAIVAGLEVPGHDAGPWDERLRRWADNWYTMLSEHRGLGTHLSQNPQTSSGIGMAKLCVDLLCEAGYTWEEALKAQAPMRWYVMGEAREEPESLRRAARFSVTPELAVTNPDLARYAEQLVSLDQREIFLHGIDLFIAGFKAELAAKRVAAASD